MHKSVAMRVAIFSPKAGLVAAFIILSAWAYVWLAGSVIVVDETQGVQTVVLTTNGGPDQNLYKIWSGFFFAIPQHDGAIEVRCRNGILKTWDYFSANMHTTLKVVGATPCAQLISGD
jgi:FlaG/FlaF family flagellin (archaellin)